MSQSKITVVTGVSSGIGRATAEMLVSRGFRVFGTVRNLARAPSLPGIEIVPMDVRSDVSVAQGIRDIIDRAGRIDVLINNAGVALAGAVEETTVDEASALFDTNVFGILRTVRAVLPHMRSQRSGRIVNISSVLGFLPGPYFGLYAASKHAVEGLSESLDHEVRQFGIRVVLVEPAFTRTNLDANSSETASTIAEYANERDTVVQMVRKKIAEAPDAPAVAKAVVDAATSCWRMRRTPRGEASLLSKLRRFMPAGPVDSSLRKEFGLAPRAMCATSACSR